MANSYDLTTPAPARASIRHWGASDLHFINLQLPSPSRLATLQPNPVKTLQQCKTLLPPPFCCRLHLSQLFIRVQLNNDPNCQPKPCGLAFSRRSVPIRQAEGLEGK